MQGGPDVSVDDLEMICSITQDKDMPDEVRAKLYKAMGRTYINEDKKLALSHLRRALELNDKAGVKKDIETLEREIRKASQ